MLSIDNVHSRYGAAQILGGVDLEVHDGEVVALLGRNGMGKTSLVRTIAGMRPPDLRGGRVVWNDEDISDLPSYEIARRGIGLVPQGRRIFGSLTVRENLTMTARGANGSGWDTSKVYEFFPRLEERATSYGKNLSGGEQQMLAIGRALMTNPRLVLMDEPSEGLAPIVVAHIRDRILELKGADLSILLVEQNLGLAMKAADRIYLLGDGGTIAWQGTPDELDADPDALHAHLGV